MTVVFFVSGHGFGHASRQVEVINALGSAAPGARLIVRTAVDAGLLARTIRPAWEHRPGACDSGIVQSSSISQDDEATLERALAFYERWEDRVSAEARALAADRPDLIVGDIPPLAFAVADRLGVPSLAIGNFTWDWIYEVHPGFAAAAGHLLPLIRDAYRTAAHALQLPMAGGFDMFASVEPLPFIARRHTRTRADTRRHLGLPEHGRVALLSFGGYGLPALDLHRIDGLGQWTVVTTDRVSGGLHRARPREVVEIAEAAFLGTEFRYEDLLAAADAVISKPGYGIIAECIAARVPLLYTSRGAFREYDVLVEAMPRVLRCRFISHDDLFAGRWTAHLDALLAEPEPPARPRLDGAEVAAKQITEITRRAD